MIVMLFAAAEVAESTTELRTPWGPETNTITAATPMTNPNMVNADRNLFAFNARNAMNRTSQMITARPLSRLSGNSTHDR
jgi:hypothetical protein